uniref:Ig-like domain-containing protein n=1 Tax=Gasterosteus aculeatus aculeatus TaxID=481459 RepID=G3N7E7_GASAC
LVPVCVRRSSASGSAVKVRSNGSCQIRTGPVPREPGAAGPARRGDACGCCPECANLEGQSCDPGDRAGFYGTCGTGMRCEVDPRSTAGGGEGEVEEGEDSRLLSVTCLRSLLPVQTELLVPLCPSVPVIKVPPLSQVNGTGRSLVFLCEVFAFPMALVEWRKEGRDVVLPGDDPHISVQSRGGPLKFEVSSWLQIEEAALEDSGTYRCVARNNVGSVSASAVLGVLGEGETVGQ